MLQICDSKGRCYGEDDLAKIKDNLNWRPISELPKVYYDTRRMFVVRGRLPYGTDKVYVSDPYCVWLSKGNTEFVRWPHKDYQPCEFMELPE